MSKKGWFVTVMEEGATRSQGPAPALRPFKADLEPTISEPAQPFGRTTIWFLFVLCYYLTEDSPTFFYRMRDPCPSSALTELRVTGSRGLV